MSLLTTVKTRDMAIVALTTTETIFTGLIASSEALLILEFVVIRILVLIVLKGSFVMASV